MRKKIVTSLVAIGTLLTISSGNLLAGDELIQNGSFENFTVEKDHGKWKIVRFDNWEGQGEVWNHQLGRVATQGTYKAELDVHRRSLNTLSQTVSTENGETYLLSLDAYARKANTSDFELLVDDQVLTTITPKSNWEKYGVEFIGSGGEQVIAIRELGSQDNGLGAIIDNISVMSGTSLDQLKAQDRAKYEIIEPSGLNQIQEIITNDRVVNSKVSAENIALAQNAAATMNALIIEAIKAEGLANDGLVSTADTMEINRYLVANHGDKWSELRAQYALIESKTEIIALNENAIKNVWGQIYNLGFPATNKNRNLTNLNGKRTSAFTTVGYYLGTVVQNDVLSGSFNNDEYVEVAGTTGTTMDGLINVILTDRGLLTRVPTSDLRAGAVSANEMNHLIKEAIITEGLGNDGQLTTADIRTVNNYLVSNYQEKWAELHGDDEDGEETGYHRIQNDGATTRYYADNVMNSIADGVYHLGFPTRFKDNLENEDGNKNQRFEKVAWWLDATLKTDLEEGKFSNPNYQEIEGTTGTTFDKIIPVIYNDEGLLLKVSMDDIRAGAKSANGMNMLIVEAMKTLGVAEDKYVTVDEVKAMNQYLVTNYATEWAELHGDDEDGEETGYHRIQNDGAVSVGYNKNIINKLADSIYHLGFPTRFANNLENEDGNKNASFTTVAYWLNKALQEDFDNDLFL